MQIRLKSFWVPCWRKIKWACILLEFQVFTTKNIFLLDVERLSYIQELFTYNKSYKMEWLSLHCCFKFYKIQCANNLCQGLHLRIYWFQNFQFYLKDGPILSCFEEFSFLKNLDRTNKEKWQVSQICTVPFLSL